MRIRPIFAWYDFWIGLFWDREKRRLCVLPVPCCGMVFDFVARPETRLPKETHPSSDDLAAWFDGATRGEETTAIARHVAGCPDCLRAVRDVRGLQGTKRSEG